MIKTPDIVGVLKERGLKITPQRVAVLEVLYNCEGEHPSAEYIIDVVRKRNPNIAKGTIYKILEVFLENKLIRRVNTDRDVMRYDACTYQHHHLYSIDSGRIEDYHDEELNRMLNEYFEKRKIPGFRIDDIQLQIKGEFFDK